MNTFKNLLIAILTGLLALSLFTQPAQSATKTYDALKLAQYTACLGRVNLYYKDSSLSSFPFDVSFCSTWKPQSQPYSIRARKSRASPLTGSQISSHCVLMHDLRRVSIDLLKQRSIYFARSCGRYSVLNGCTCGPHRTVRFARPVGASASKTKGPLKSGDLQSLSYAICIASLKATALAVSNRIKNSLHLRRPGTALPTLNSLWGCRQGRQPKRTASNAGLTNYQVGPS